MHATRTNTARKELIGANAIECHRLDFLVERQHAIVFQKHNSFIGSTTSDGSMCIQVGSIACLIFVKRWSLHDIFQQTTNTVIHILDVELSVLHLRNDFLALLRLTWLHEVVACMNLSSRIALPNPIGHHHSLITPIGAEYIGEQVSAFLCQRSIDAIVRSHHSPRLSLANSNFETAQIEFTQCTLRHSFIHTRALRLLRIHSKVLDARASTLALHTLHISSSDFSRHNRVFGIILEVASTKRIAMKVHTWTQNHVTLVFLGFVTNCLAHFLHQFGIPSGSQCRTNRKCRGIISLGVTFTSRIDANASRTISENRLRNTQTRNGSGSASSARHSLSCSAHYGSVRKEVIGTSHQYSRFLFERHGSHHFVDVVRPQLRGTLCTCIECYR